MVAYFEGKEREDGEGYFSQIANENDSQLKGKEKILSV